MTQTPGPAGAAHCPPTDPGTTYEPTDFTRADAIGDITRYLEHAMHVFGRYQDRFGGDVPVDPLADVVGPAAVAVRMFCAKADVNSALRMLREAATFDHPSAAGEAGARLKPSVSTNTGGASPGGDAHAPGAGDSIPRASGRASVPHMTFTAAPCTCPFCRPRVSGWGRR